MKIVPGKAKKITLGLIVTAVAVLTTATVLPKAQADECSAQTGTLVVQTQLNPPAQTLTPGTFNLPTDTWLTDVNTQVSSTAFSMSALQSDCAPAINGALLPGWAAAIISFAAGGVMGVGCSIALDWATEGLTVPYTSQIIGSIGGFVGTMLQGFLTEGKVSLETVAEAVIAALLAWVPIENLKAAWPAVQTALVDAGNSIKTAVGVGWFTYIKPYLDTAANKVVEFVNVLSQAIAARQATA